MKTERLKLGLLVACAVLLAGCATVSLIGAPPEQRPSEYQITKAKRIYREAHPDCALCGIGPSFLGENNPVHHVMPVEISCDQGRASLSTNQNNFITFCKIHHFWIGHLKNYHDYNMNVHNTVEELKRALEKHGESYLGSGL